jgi:hypothetical protein
VHEELILSAARWVNQWAARFFAEVDPSDHGPLAMKVEHTAAVASNAVVIATGEGMDERTASLGLMAAWLHDCGRFPQYAKYRTFKDTESVNHGELGARIITEHRVLHGLPKPDRTAVVSAVCYHNTFGLPRLDDPLGMAVLKLVRDADKLDVWRVVADWYEAPEDAREGVVNYCVPEGGGFTPEVVDAFCRGEVIPLGMISGQDDLKLLRLSWAFDLHHATTRAEALARGDLGRIAATLPPDERVRDALVRLIGA